MRRRQKQAWKTGLIFLVLAAFLLIIAIFLFSNPERQAKAVVEEFYELEASGNFSESWKLLHPFMMERFSKSAYVQDRAHVFNGHFGAETFTFTIGDGKKLKEWKMEKDRPSFRAVYHFLVTQHYNGKYGSFHFQQEVYATEDKNGKWKIAWDFSKQ